MKGGEVVGRPARSLMLRVGLTGGLASGKSTVAAMLRELGAAVFDADEIVRAPLRARAARARRGRRELFGDRRARHRRARSTGPASPRSSSRTRPRATPSRRASTRWCGAERARRFAEAERRGAAVAVAEASQLFEAGTESRLRPVLLVVAPEAERLRRWEAKGGDAEDARRRMAAQIPADAARARAHDVLVNDGTLEDLRRQASRTLYRRWTA